MNPYKHFVNNILFAFVAVLALQPQVATAQQTKPAAGSAFSFAVYGDSRSMMYLPYKSDQKEEAPKLMVDMFELVLPEKVAEEVVKKDVKLIYDPATKELVQIVMPFMTQSEVTDVDGGQGLGHRGVGRGRETASRRAPHDVPAARRRVGCPRGRERCQERAGQVHSQYRRHGLVGQAGREALREPVLEAGVRGRAEAAAGSGRSDAGRRAARARFPRRRQSRSVGRLRCRRPVECLSLSEKVRGFGQATHLQVRFRRRSLHLPVDRQIRLSRAHGVGCHPARVRSTDEAVEAVAG